MRLRIEGKTACEMAALALAALAVGCGGAPGGAGAGNPETLPAPGQKLVKFSSQPLRHFQPGDTWSYVLRRGKESQTSVIAVLPDKVKSPDGTQCSVFQITAGAAGQQKKVYGAFVQDKNGSEMLYGTSTTDLKGFIWGIPPNDHSDRIQSPLFPSEHWRNTMRRQDGSVLDYEALVLKEETVTVPAGTFKSMLIHEASNVQKPKQKMTHHEDSLWIVPSIGFPVKQLTPFKNGDVTQELVSYKLSGKTTAPAAAAKGAPARP